MAIVTAVLADVACIGKVFLGALGVKFYESLIAVYDSADLDTSHVNKLTMDG